MMHRLRSRRVSFFTFLLLLAVGLTLSSRLGRAQAGLATLSGTVTDQSGSVIPGVGVTAINTSTGVAYRSESNTSGAYYIGALPPGPYKITAEKTGFKQWTRTLQLEVSQNASVDFRMEVGSTTTVVEVTGAPPIINTTGTQVGDVKDYQRINQLPLNGRQVTNLFDLTPGVEGGGNARVNGMKTGSMGIQLDGISERDRFGGGMVRIQPDIQDVQEFSVDTSGSDAKYANPSTVILKTRSGTNQLHGEIFETNRDATGALQARLRQQAPGSAYPKDIRNEFGGNVGGPLVIPHVYNGKDKTFFFFSYEGYREVGRADSYGGITPTAAMWNGDLSNANDGSGNPVVIYDPLTTDANGLRQPFPGNIIPAGRISSIAKTLQAITALPTNSANPYVANNLESVYPSFSTQNKLTGKVDENISAKDRLSVRWSRQTWFYDQSGGLYGNPRNCPDCGGSSRENSSVTNVNADYTRTISNTMLNQLIVGALRTPTSSGTLGDNTNWDAKLGLPNPFGVTGWPTVYADNFPWDADNRKDEHLTSYIAEDNFTWVKGKHTVEIGGAFHMEQNNVRELQQSMGSDNFGGEWTCQFDPVAQSCLKDTGEGFSGLLLGLPDYLSNQYNRGYFYFRQKYYSWYINDKWRVTPRLTLNLGVRWDKWTPYSEKQNRLVTAPLDSILNSFQVITPGNNAISSLPGIPPAVLQSWSNRGLGYSTADAYQFPSNLFAPDNNNFGPRLGAAFKVDDKTVIRGSYGVFYWPTPLAQILQTSRTNPPLNLRFQNQFYGPDAYGEGNPPNFNYMISSAPSANNFLPNASVDTVGVVPLSPGAQGIFPYDGRNWHNDKMQNWNITIERQIPYRSTLRVSYIGNHGSDLDQRVDLNDRLPQIVYAQSTGEAPASNPLYSQIGADFLRPNPNWNLSYGYGATNGISNSQLVQAQVEHKYHNGTVFQWYYVYDHGLSTTDTGGFSSGNLGGFNSGGTPGVGGSGGGSIPENSDLLSQPNLSSQQLRSLVYSNMVTIPVQHYGWNGLVDLPFGKGKKFLSGASGPLNQLVGGWQVAFIGDWTSGFWQSVSTSLVQNGDPRLSPDQRLTMNYAGKQQQLWFAGNLDMTQVQSVQGGTQALTNLVGTDGRKFVRPYGPDCSQSQAGTIDPNLYDGNIGVLLPNNTCYSAPTNDFYNGSPRGEILGPSAFTMDASAFKNFSIGERVKVRFTADFFNVLNHPTNNQPNSSTGLIDLSTQANNPRLMQFSLHVLF
jgi:hypothetical protein